MSAVHQARQGTQFFVLTSLEVEHVSLLSGAGSFLRSHFLSMPSSQVCMQAKRKKRQTGAPQVPGSQACLKQHDYVTGTRQRTTGLTVGIGI